MDAPSVSPALAAPQPPQLLESPRQRIRVLHYSIRTEQACVDWVRRFILFFGKRHPREMGALVTTCLTLLAGERNVCVSTQNQAKAASVRTTMIYPHVLNKSGRGVPSPLDAL